MLGNQHFFVPQSFLKASFPLELLKYRIVWGRDKEWQVIVIMVYAQYLHIDSSHTDEILLLRWKIYSLGQFSLQNKGILIHFEKYNLHNYLKG